MAVLGWPKTLNWTHFGKPRTSVPLAYGGSHTDCHIEIDIDYSWQGTRRLTPGGDYALREVKVVVKTNSLDTWVIAGVPTASNQARVLKHEQGHYNIAGITARDVERALVALRNSDSSALEAEATRGAQTTYPAAFNVNNSRFLGNTVTGSGAGTPVGGATSAVSARTTARCDGTNWASVFRVSRVSMPLSLATISRKLGRFEASTTPLRSTIRPRGGGVILKLNWLEADSFV